MVKQSLLHPKHCHRSNRQPASFAVHLCLTPLPPFVLSVKILIRSALTVSVSHPSPLLLQFVVIAELHNCTCSNSRGLPKSVSTLSVVHYCILQQFTVLHVVPLKILSCSSSFCQHTIVHRCLLQHHNLPLTPLLNPQTMTKPMLTLMVDLMSCLRKKVTID